MKFETVIISTVRSTLLKNLKFIFQFIFRKEPTNLLSVFDHFVGLAREWLIRDAFSVTKSRKKRSEYNLIDRPSLFLVNL